MQSPIFRNGRILDIVHIFQGLLSNALCLEKEILQAELDKRMYDRHTNYFVSIPSISNLFHGLLFYILFYTVQV